MAIRSVSYAEPKTHYIYALIDPRTETVYYVGQTVDLTNRMYGHKSGARNWHEHTVPVYKQTKEILKAGLEPIVVTLDSVETLHLEIALRLEECWRIEMLQNDETLSNSWKTGVCVDTDNPMTEAEFVKSYAMATSEQMLELAELDKVRALRKVWG
jgi:hypothetical protein